MNARIGIVHPGWGALRRSPAGVRSSVAGLIAVALAAAATPCCPAEAEPLARNASPAPAVPALTLTAVLARVAAVHPLMQRARAELDVSRQQLEGARWGRFPSLALGASGGDGVVSGGSIRLQQPLYTFGRLDHAIDAAQASFEAGTSGIALARRALVERAALAHARWLSGLQQHGYAERNVARQQELLAFIARRAEGGLAVPGDTRLAQGRLDQARARAAALRSVVDQARAELESLMLQRLVAQPVAPSLPAVGYASAGALASAFVDASPALERLAGQQRAASAEAALKGAERLPAVVARLERTPNLITSHYDTRTLLAVDYQSGAGLSAQSEYLARLGRIDALRAETEVQRRELELQAATLWVQRATLVEQQASIDGLVASSIDTVESFMRQFDAGRRSWLDVLNAERELFEARLAQAQVEAGLLDTAIRIHTGTGVFDRLAGQP